MWPILLAACVGQVSAELAGRVGPVTSFASKAATKTCNIIDYGASTNGSDMSSALSGAWSDCAVGGLVYIPPGNWSLASFPELKDGSQSAVQLDGVIHRTGSDGSTMISFRNCHDFEFFSGNSKGAIQGYGHEYLADGDYGPRLTRFQDMGNFSIHGIALIDSPSYYLTLDTVTNGEIYNIIMRGPTTLGGTDAIDVWGSNVWVHDIEATNGDECVTVKSPASNFLIESIYCNQSGGNSIGSLSTGTDISDITYRHIYANNAEPCFIKSNAGNGTVQNIVWDTVTVRNSAYPLSIDSEWGSARGAGNGVQYTNFTFKNWHGYNDDNARPNIRLWCPPGAPCTDITLDNVNLWTEGSSYAVQDCWNAYGSGACLRSISVSASTFTSARTVTAAPTYSTSWMPNDFSTGLLANSSFTIPPVPTSFYPGLKPSSSLLHLSGPGRLVSGSIISSNTASSKSTPLSRSLQAASTQKASSSLTTGPTVGPTVAPTVGPAFSSVADYQTSTVEPQQDEQPIAFFKPWEHEHEREHVAVHIAEHCREQFRRHH